RCPPARMQSDLRKQFVSRPRGRPRFNVLRRELARQRLRAAALPPLRPAALWRAVVPPCLELPPDPDFFPPRLDAPGEFAIFAARSFDIPFSLRASYCLRFLGLDDFEGM